MPRITDEQLATVIRGWDNWIQGLALDLQDTRRVIATEIFVLENLSEGTALAVESVIGRLRTLLPE